jgi:hypothetical protein
MITTDRLFYFVIALIFLATLIWVHSIWILLGISLISGFLPISKSYFTRYWAVAAISMFVALLIHQPELRILEILGSILPIGSYAYLLASVVVTSLSLALPAYTVQQFVYSNKRKR